jgi:hypothetical protein
VPVRGTSVVAIPPRGQAYMRARNLPMPDFGDFMNANVNGPSVPSVVSYDIEWFESATG